jgi:hypothetical protein
LAHYLEIMKSLDNASKTNNMDSIWGDLIYALFKTLQLRLYEGLKQTA